MLARIERALDLVSRVLAQIAALTLWILTGFVILSAVMRYFLRRPFNFTEELVGLLFLATIFLAIPRATFNREHISVPLLVNVLPAAWRRVAEVIAALVMIAFGILFTIESWKFAAFSLEIGARAEQSLMPVWPWQAVMPLGIGLMAFIAALRLLMFFVHGATSAGASDRSSGSPL